MKKVVEIEWDGPAEEQWLCPDNIKAVLETYCSNTKFNVTEVEIVDIEKLREEINLKIDKLRLMEDLKK